jgi:hypothetical protein
MSGTGFRASRFDGRAWQAADVEWWDGGSIRIPFDPIDQGEAKCCVGAAITAAMEILDNRNERAERLSPLYSYFTSRLRPTRWRGAVALDDALYAASTKGICAFALHEGHYQIASPYDEDAAFRPPTPEADADAEQRRIVGYDVSRQTMAYYEISGDKVAAEWARAIEAGHPVAFGFVPSPVYLAMTAEDFIVADVSSERGNPGHAALAVGYRDGRFRIRDSRGLGFADGGYWELAEAVVGTRWVAESWVITRITYDD